MNCDELNKDILALKNEITSVEGPLKSAAETGIVQKSILWDVEDMLKNAEGLLNKYHEYFLAEKIGLIKYNKTLLFESGAGSDQKATSITPGVFNNNAGIWIVQKAEDSAFLSRKDNGKWRFQTGQPKLDPEMKEGVIKCNLEQDDHPCVVCRMKNPKNNGDSICISIGDFDDDTPTKIRFGDQAGISTLDSKYLQRNKESIMVVTGQNVFECKKQPNGWTQGKMIKGLRQGINIDQAQVQPDGSVIVKQAENCYRIQKEGENWKTITLPVVKESAAKVIMSNDTIIEFDPSTHKIIEKTHTENGWAISRKSILLEHNPQKIMRLTNDCIAILDDSNTVQICRKNDSNNWQTEMRFGISQSWNPEDIKQILEGDDGGNYIVFYEAEDGHTKVEEVRARKDEVNVENLLDRMIRGAEEK